MWKTRHLSGGGEALSDMRLALPESVLTLRHGMGEQNWFAVFTTSCHEKKVAKHFAARELTSFLPVYRTLSAWKNGCKVVLDRPLFPNYLFVRASRKERGCILSVPGVLSVLGSIQAPAIVPDEFIESLRSGLNSYRVEPHPYLVVGERARITRGAFEGMEGVVLRKKNSLRVVLSVDVIMKSIAIEVDADDLASCRE